MDLSETSKMSQEEQFNQQRAKMKELYLAKEKECVQLKQKLLVFKKEIEEASSQLVIAEYNREKDLEDQKMRHEQEVQTLNQLIQETCDESTLAHEEIKRLQDENERYKSEVTSLREQQQQESKSLDALLGLKTLARNVKKITGTNNSSQENLEDSARKLTGSASKYAQEDADTLRSLVVPLEDEILQLKEKLRAAYDEMEQIRGETQHKSALVGLLSEAQKDEGVENESDSIQECPMCKNYELQLCQAQESIENEKQKVVKVEKIVDRLKQDLMKESALRLDLEKTWQRKREEHKDAVQKLCDKLNESERQMIELQSEFCNFKDDVSRELVKVMEERTELHEHLETLQRDNEYLSGRYLEHSNQMKDQDINLPQSIEELHELVLKLYENLIVSKVGQEFNETKCVSFRDETNLLRDQLHQKEKEKLFIEQKQNHRIHSLEDKLKIQHQNHLKLIGEKEELLKIENDNKKEISDLRMQNIELSENVDRLEKANFDVKSKLTMLQQELSTSEQVQKDFVKLSQSLQMQLEKIRSADSQVRWQDLDDVDKCPTCKLEFTVTRRKRNCRHCGTIFCESCCNRSVKSGPSQKVAKVCDLCNTLLQANQAPYFSENAPQSPI
ncbi:rab GTPase-binding effector protein 1-like [Chironomus tepperi]|uniref:rab GTPase-binding effector protein 1-like n=1 Tax=Chironomus tepperi TaxID=113505 RepID=UPI00391F60F6